MFKYGRDKNTKIVEYLTYEEPKLWDRLKELMSQVDESKGITLEKLIIKEQLVTEDKLVRVRSAVTGIPYADLKNITIRDQVLNCITGEIAMKYCCLPMEYDDVTRAEPTITFVTDEPEDATKWEDLRLITKKDVLFYFGTRTEILQKIGELYPDQKKEISGETGTAKKDHHTREQELLLYRDFEDDQLLYDMAFLMTNYEDEYYNKEDLRSLFYQCIHQLLELAGNFGFHGNLWHCYLANILVNCENSYSKGCEIRGAIQGSINDAALHDIVIFKEFYDYDFQPMMEALQVPEFSLIQNYVASSEESKVYNRRICARICELAEHFCENRTPQEMKDTLTEFYKEYGVGKFGLHKSFRIAHEESGEGNSEGSRVQVNPILNIAHVKLDDLVGYEIPKQKLIENTEAFVSGRKANNCLLFGDAGTGKSSCIKAIANEYYDRGLRVIEVYKHQFQDLNDVIAQIKNRNYKFIIYMDDLSFEDFEIEYKYLKAVIEGGLEKKPQNVLIYATSNRRHLIRENYGDRPEIREDMHTGDTVQEKLSLVSRFGVTIYFGAPTKKEFQQIVRELAKREGITMPEEELLLEANKWELAHGGLSGRTAQQFIDYLLGRA